jgi:hypothetical protein
MSFLIEAFTSSISKVPKSRHERHRLENRMKEKRIVLLNLFGDLRYMPHKIYIRGVAIVYACVGT